MLSTQYSVYNVELTHVKMNYVEMTQVGITRVESKWRVCKCHNFSVTNRRVTPLTISIELTNSTFNSKNAERMIQT